MPTVAALLLPIVVGLIWGVTNPFIARGTRKAATCPVPRRTGLAPLDSLLHHLLTPAYIIPQALNSCGSVLFAATLGGGNVSIAAPVANGASLAVNAVIDHLLGDCLSRPGTGVTGVLLVCLGVALCSLAQEQH